jgi:allantoinase
MAGVRCHVVHLASGDAVESIRKAKFVENLPLSVETCHHYLNLDAEVKKNLFNILTNF